MYILFIQKRTHCPYQIFKSNNLLAAAETRHLWTSSHTYQSFLLPPWTNDIKSKIIILSPLWEPQISYCNLYFYPEDKAAGSSKTLVPTYKTIQRRFQGGGNFNSGTVHTKYRLNVMGCTNYAHSSSNNITTLLLTWTLTKSYRQTAMVDAIRLVTWSRADKTLMTWQMLSVLTYGNQQTNDRSFLAPTSQKAFNGTHTYELYL